MLMVSWQIEVFDRASGRLVAAARERVLAADRAGVEPVDPVAAEHDRSGLAAAHQDEADAGVVDQHGQQVGEVLLDGLQVDPAGVFGERHHRDVTGDHHDHAGGRSRHRAGRAFGRAAPVGRA